MANPQQQAGTAPEAIWIPFIWDLYPKLLNQTYFLPPIHFNRTPQAVETIAGQTVLVRDNPSVGASGKQPPVKPPARVAGTVYVKNPSDLQPVHTHESDHRDDAGQQSCLHALSNISNQVMVVISSLEFQKYLSSHTNPLYAAAIAQLPTVHHKSIPSNIANGECDIIIIHRTYGLVIGEIKSVGDNDFFHKQSPADQIQVILKQIGKAVKQLSNQEKALRHLVSDLPPIRITKTLMLPNISTGQLQSALSASPSLLQTLCQTLSLHGDVNMAVGHCLCEQDVGQPLTWWQRLFTAGPDQLMTDSLHLRLVARFCGPATTVDIPTPNRPRKVVRSLGAAAAETGLRFSSLVLTPTQVALLNQQPEPRFLFLLGPPGTGKTVVLLLKALQWARQGQQVIVISGDEQSRAVTMLLESQLRSLVGPRALAASIQRLCCKFTDDSFNAKAAVASLQRQIRPGPVLIIFDEADGMYRQYVQWLTDVRAQLPAVSVWAAGVVTWGTTLGVTLPSWLNVHTLQEPLRCPPTVTAKLQQSGLIRANHILPYTEPLHPVATQGPPVQRLQHQGQPGHSGQFPWECDACTDLVADILRQLRVGQPGHALQYRDTWILYDGGRPSDSDVMVMQLRLLHTVPIHVVNSQSLSLADVRQLALAVRDKIIVTDWGSVQGLERRVVIVLGEDISGWALHLHSRCSSYLHILA